MSISNQAVAFVSLCFNPRPPKRTLCPLKLSVLQRIQDSFNPRPPKRTLCRILALRCRQLSSCFNPRPPKRTLCRHD